MMKPVTPVFQPAKLANWKVGVTVRFIEILRLRIRCRRQDHWRRRCVRADYFGGTFRRENKYQANDQSPENRYVGST